MNRELTYTIVVDDAQAKTTVAEFESSVGKSGKAISDLDKQVDALTKTHAAAKGAVDDFAKTIDKTTISAQAADAALKAMNSGASATRTVLNQIGEAAGVTYGNLGLLGSGFAVLTVATAAWDLGRKIAEVTNADSVISNFTAKLLKLGDAEAEIAGAKGDALALASQRAGFEVTNLTQALQINTEWVQRWKDTAAQLAAPQEAIRSIREWRGEIEVLRANGAIPALTRDLQMHVLSQKELEDRYRLSSEALALFRRELEQTAEAERRNLQERDRFIQEGMRRMEASLELQRKAHEIELSMVRTTSDLTHLSESRLEFEKKLTAELAQQKQYLEETTRQEQIAAGLRNGIGGVQPSTDAAGAVAGDFQNRFSALNARAAANPLVSYEAEFLKITKDFADALDKASGSATNVADAHAGAAQAGTQAAAGIGQAGQAGYETAVAFRRAMQFIPQVPTPDSLRASTLLPGSMLGFGLPGQNIPSAPLSGLPPPRAMGGPVDPSQSYLVGERGPELFRPSTAGAIVPNAGGVSVGDIHIHGNVDSEFRARQTAQMAADEVMRRLKQTGGRQTYGRG